MHLDIRGYCSGWATLAAINYPGEDGTSELRRASTMANVGEPSSNWGGVSAERSRRRGELGEG